MNRVLLILLLFLVCCVAACQKSSQYGIVQYKAQAKIDDTIISQYIRTNGLTDAKRVNDTSGVYYIILEPGEGATLFTNSTQITVGDTGRVITSGILKGDGPVFYKTNNFHPTYPLGQLLLGWQLGVPMIKTGGRVRLIMASRYAYGHFPHAELGLQANAILDFRIRLYDVTN